MMKPSRSQVAAHKILVATLAITLAVNLTLIGKEHGPTLAPIRKTLTKSTGWRSANYAFGQKAADFYEFLNRNISPDSRVLIPSRNQGPLAFSHASVAQFLLWPRTIVNCTGEFLECAANPSANAVIILDLPTFPQQLGPNQSILAFNDELGVFTLISPASHNGWQDFASLWQWLQSLAIGIGSILLLGVAGGYFARGLFPGFTLPLRLSLGFALTIGLSTLLQVFLLLLGLQFSDLTVFLSLALGWIILAGITRFVGRNHQRVVFQVHWQQVILVGVAGIVAFIAIGQGYSRTDEIVLWGAKGYGIISDGLQEGASNWGTLTTRYPLNTPLMISYSVQLFGDRLPEAKLLFPAFYLALLFVLYEFTFIHATRNTGLLATLCIGTSPILFLHGTLAYANLPMAFYLTSGVALLSLSSTQSDGAAKRGHMLAASLMLVLAAWTRPEGLPLAWGLALLFTAMNWRSEIIHRSDHWFLFLLLTVYSIGWAVMQPFIYQTPGFFDGAVSAMLNGIQNGNFHLKEAAYIIGYFASETFNVENWGGISFLMSLLVLFIARKKALRFRFSLGAATLTVLAILGLYFSTTYVEGAGFDASWWVSTGLNRMMMPAILFCFVYLIAEVSSFMGIKGFANHD